MADSREVGPSPVAAFGAPRVEGPDGGRASRAEIAALLRALAGIGGKLPDDNEIVVLADGTILADDEHPLLVGLTRQRGVTLRCED